jgi:hypothetical protein
MTKITNKKKWIISAWSVVAVIVVFNPLIFQLTNLLRFISPMLQTVSSTGITMTGWVLHWTVFFFLVRLMMEIKLPGSDD